MPTPPDARRALQARSLALLEEVYLRYAHRYGKTGLRLDGFGGRWLALRMATATDPSALPVIDEEPGEFDGDFSRFRREAVAQADSEMLIFVRMRRVRGLRIHGSGADPRQRLSIAVSPSAGAWGLTGSIELDAGGRAVAPGAPVPVSLVSP